jgi:hypothetical protein
MIFLKTVNKEIAKYGYELFRGKGYFYFTPLNPYNHSTPSFFEEGVYHNGLITLNDLSLNEWVEELKIKIEINNGD